MLSSILIRDRLGISNEWTMGEQTECVDWTTSSSDESLAEHDGRRIGLIDHWDIRTTSLTKRLRVQSRSLLAKGTDDDTDGVEGSEQCCVTMDHENDA